MPEPDQTDIRIITALQKNGKSTNSAIATKLGVSEETVRRRVNRLMDADLLQIVAVPDRAAFGFHCEVFIFVNATPNRIDEVAERLGKISEIGFVGLTSGEFDILAIVNLPSILGMNDFLQQKLRPIPGLDRFNTIVNLATKKRSVSLPIGRGS